jgi:sigma-B regulation protein RsbU (phosphoserine phosphatase)
MPGLAWPRTRNQAIPPEQRLLRHYNWTITTAYAAVTLGLLGFFAFQLRQDLQTQVTQLEAQVERHGHALDLVLGAAADQADTLRAALAAHRTSDACQAGRRQVADGPLRQVGSQFTWHAVPGRTVGGRLQGEGTLAGRSDAFYCDLGALLALVPHLQAMVVHLPAASRATFLSAQDFRFETPGWPASTRVTARVGFPDAEVWRLAQPETNPSRRRYWANPYWGGVNLGLLAPIAAPVYAGDRFLGVLAIDMRLDALDPVHAAMGDARGTVALVDAQGRVLAHPTQTPQSHPMRSPVRLEQTVASGALASPKALDAMVAGRAQTHAGWIVIRRPLASAPWQLVYTVPRAALWQALLAQRGAAVSTVLIALGLIMAGLYALTWHGFVGPATRLVSHAMAESSQQGLAAPQVPRAWQPWFDAITRVFRESLQLGSLRRELDIAARLQQSILPRQWPQDPRYDLWGTMRAAKDIGGDFYDHFELPADRRGLVVADVSGKGIPAGLFGMVSKTLLRAIATQRDQAVGEAVREVNDGLCADNESSMFVTAFYGQYNPASGHLVYVNAGHPPPLVLRARGTMEWLDGPGGTALGVVPGLSYQAGTVDLAPGDTLLVFTDGVTEAVNADGQEFGKPRLSALFDGRPAAAAREAIERLLARLDRYAQDVEPHDDITCLALHCRRVGSDPGPSPTPASV